jgi:ABC-type transport system substrate-binding protein
MAAPPAEVEVNPGKLSIMVGDFGNERFDNALTQVPTGGHNYARIVGGFLISTNERTEMIPGIASQWGISADGLTWTFTIREGVKWHDGSELVREDVLWTLQHTFGPQAVEYSTNNTVAAVSRAMNKIELSGPDTVSLTTKEPVTHLALIVSEAGASSWFQVMPKRATLHDTEAEAAYDNNPIGAGPMSLEEHISAQMMRFERFDDFYYQPDNGFPEDKRIKVQSLDLHLIPEEATRVAALRSGEADIVPASLVTKDQVEAGGGRLVFGPEGVYVWVRLYGCFEPQHSCHDKRVRQALDYAINKELLRDQLYGGPEVFQTKGWGVATPSTIGYTPALDPWPFDPEKARQLLADAGYPGGEGFGKLIVNTFPSTSMPFQVEAAQLAADLWRRELGIDVEVRVGESTGVKEKEVAGELNGQVIWRDNETRTDAANVLVTNYGDPKGSNRLHEDPEIFHLVQETLQIVDPDKRAEASKKLFPRLREETYELGIGYVNIPWGVGPRVVTWEPYPLAVYPSALHTITLK